MSTIVLAGVTVGTAIASGAAFGAALLHRQRAALQTARQQALHDDVTGLPNRRALLHHLTAALRSGRPVGVVLLDLDKFKTVNDQHGHDTGNQLLAHIAGRLAALDRPVTLAARLSGDEFALLVAGNGDDTAAAAYTAWHAVADEPVPLPDGPYPLSASAGHAVGRLGLTPRQLLHHADLAMYRAKAAGGGVAAHLLTDPGPAAGRPRDRRRP